VIAIDAPAQLSGAPHAGDETLSPKFRAARCAEVALGRAQGIWVSWVAPAGPPLPGWMAVGVGLHRRLAPRAAVIEVYPHAAFHLLAGRRPAKKQSAAGMRERVELLTAAGVVPPDEGLSHHAIDALAAALVARDRLAGCAHAVGCGHDDSLIWLPAARAVTGGAARSAPPPS